MADDLKLPPGATLVTQPAAITLPPGAVMVSPGSGGPAGPNAPLKPKWSAQNPQPWWDKLSDTLEEFNTHLEQGIGDAGRGALEFGKRILDPNPPDVRGQVSRMVAGPLGPILSDILASHVETGKKAIDQFKQGNYGKAAAYSTAARIPVVGPALANLTEQVLGTPEERDDSGRVTVPAQPGQPARAFGNVLGNVMIGGVTEGAGELLGSGGNALRAGTAKAASSVVPFRSQLNPVEQNAIDFLRDRGVPMTPGTQTGNKFLRANEATTKHSPLGAQTASDFGRSTTAGIQRVGGDLADEIHPIPATPETAGRSVRKSLGKTIDDLSLDRDAAYQDAWMGRGDPTFNERVPVRTRQVPELGNDGLPTGRTTTEPVFADVNMPVDVRDLKTQAAPILDEMDWMPAADKASSAGYRALQKIVEGDDFIPAWQAENGLSGLKDMARVTRKSGVRDTGQGIAASLVGDLQQQIDSAVARTGKPAIAGLQKGRAIHAHVMGIADLADKLRSEPVQTFRQMTWANDSGIDLLRQVEQQAPGTMPEVGRAWFQQLLEKGSREGGFSKTQGLLNQWRELGPETQKILVPDPQLRANLGNFLKGADMVEYNPNTSGTELTRQATSTNPLRWAAGYLGSKAFFTPRGIQLLTQGLRPSGPGAAAFIAARLKAMRGAGAAVSTGTAVEQQDTRPPLNNFHR